jgi:dolichol-phosphate mannosyltransferase
MNEKIYISIATYNERENIEKLIRDIYAINIPNLAIIITDDNSPDGTAEIVENLQSNFSSLQLIKRSGKLGYGSAHIAGFRRAISAGAQVIISMDADFSHDPKYLPLMLAQLNSGFDVVVGSRKIDNGKVVGWSLWRKFCSQGAMALSKIMLGIKTRDLTSGYRAYDAKVFAVINLDQIKSEGYSFLEELIYKIEKKGFKVKEIPIVFFDRRLGQSKLSRKEIINFFITIFKMKFNRK